MLIPLTDYHAGASAAAFVGHAHAYDWALVLRSVLIRMLFSRVSSKRDLTPAWLEARTRVI
jgi:hypothetical protein